MWFFISQSVEDNKSELLKMTDSMKFGPEWLRNLSADGTQAAAPKYQLAEHRYGREEMLALFDRQVKAPDRLMALPALYVEKTQPPLALLQMNEDETRQWNRGINSDAVLRLNGKAAPVSIPGPRGGLVGSRGGSVDRGRGRARGQGYHYQRGLSYEEVGDMMMPDGSASKAAYNRNMSRPFDRAQSMAGGDRGWSERNGMEQQEWNGSTSPRKEFVRGVDNNWRRPRGSGEDEDGWRTATATGSTKYVRPSSWREGDKEVEMGGGRWEGSRGPRGWDPDSHSRHHMEADNLPEWAMDVPSESGGTFDASGAFHGGGNSDLEDEDSAILERQPKAPSPEQPKKKSPPPATSTNQQPVAKSQSMTTVVSPPAPTVNKSPSEHHIAQNNGIKQPSNHFPLLTEQKFAPNFEQFAPVDARVGAMPHPVYASQPSARFAAPPTLGFNPPKTATPPLKLDAELDKMMLEDGDVLVDKLLAANTERQDKDKWFYRDPQSQVQGPFSATEMDEWFRAGYFNTTLLVRRGCDEVYAQLGELIAAWGRVPFLPGPPVPPLLDPRVNAQQQQFQAVLGKLAHTERWDRLSEQQQLLFSQLMDNRFSGPQPSAKIPVLEQFISQMKQPVSVDKSIPLHHLMKPPAPAPAPVDKPHPLQHLIQQMGGAPPVLDPVQNLMRQINANAHANANAAKPQMDVWGNPLNTQSWAMAGPPPGQQVPMTMWDMQGKDLKTEQQILEERFQAEELKRVEEAIKKDAEEKRRKQEEEQKWRELEKQRLEEERLLREEEAKRKEEEEKRLLLEQKRLEEEARKKEEKKRKEEEKRKREEEKKRKEEEKERKRKQEEDLKREEEERIMLEEEAMRKRLEEEEHVRRLEQQSMALKRLAEQQRQKQAPWSQHTPGAGSSLQEIQRQEKVQKERESREQQALLQQQLQQQQQASLLAVETKANSLQLNWADRKPSHAGKVKSLSEIQAEEAKQAEREKAEQRKEPSSAAPPSAGIWSSAPQSLTWAAAVAPSGAWGASQALPPAGAGFWDDVVPPAPKPTAPANRPAKAKSAANPSPPAKTRNKKEEAVVMKMFESREDDFTMWCSAALHSLEAHVDIPTFVGFLRDIESPYEVKDYVKMYLGEGKEAQEFARQFLERRSKWRSAQRAQPQHDDLAAPAPAINPSATDFQEVKGKAKKMKKNKMFKVDNRILGFSVTAAQDRINVGDRDYGEGV